MEVATCNVPAVLSSQDIVEAAEVRISPLCGYQNFAVLLRDYLEANLLKIFLVNLNRRCHFSRQNCQVFLLFLSRIIAIKVCVVERGQGRVSISDVVWNFERGFANSHVVSPLEGQIIFVDTYKDAQSDSRNHDK